MSDYPIDAEARQHLRRPGPHLAPYSNICPCCQKRYGEPSSDLELVRCKRCEDSGARVIMTKGGLIIISAGGEIGHDGSKPARNRPRAL